MCKCTMSQMCQCTVYKSRTRHTPVHVTHTVCTCTSHMYTCTMYLHTAHNTWKSHTLYLYSCYIHCAHTLSCLPYINARSYISFYISHCTMSLYLALMQCRTHLMSVTVQRHHTTTYGVYDIATSYTPQSRLHQKVVYTLCYCTPDTRIYICAWGGYE